MEHQDLSNPPIIEALVDVRVRPRAGLLVAELEAAGTAVGDKFPVLERQHAMEFRLDLPLGRQPQSSSSELGVQGIRVHTVDRSRLIQFRRDGFTLNWLKPYAGWTALKALALEGWNSYLKFVAPEEIARVGVRYINRTSVPSHCATTQWLFRNPANLLDGLGPTPESIYQRYSMAASPDDDKRALVQFSLEPNPEGGGSLFTLDLDVFHADGLSSTDERALSDALESLRPFKNDLFFGILSDDFLEPFK